MKYFLISLTLIGLFFMFFIKIDDEASDCERSYLVFQKKPSFNLKSESSNTRLLTATGSNNISAIVYFYVFLREFRVLDFLVIICFILSIGKYKN